jgi:ABC-type nitrate/sulfonate/bicarbonate transport system substrate-binding protein
VKRYIRKKFFSLAWVSLVVELSISLTIHSAGAAVTIRMGYPQPSGAMLPLWLIPDAKLDQKYGVEVQNIFISGGSRLTQTLVAGDVDMATTGGAVVNAVLSGADLVCLAIGVPTYGFSMYARPEVKDVAALRGKVVGVMTKGASSDHSAIALFRSNHMQPGQDVKFLYLGGVREVLAALERGIIAAGVISAPTTLLARRLGFKEVINIATLKLPYIHSGVVSRRALIRQQPEKAKGYLKAYVAAIKIANEDAETSKRVLARNLATNDAGVIDEAYQTFRGVFPKVPYMTEDYIKSVLAVVDHPKAAGAKPGDFFDNRFLKELEDSGFVQELYGRK